MRNARKKLPGGTTYGNQEIYADSGSVIMEVTHPDAINDLWPLCSEAVFLAIDKVLITTEASSATWQTALDTLLQKDPEAAATKLRWRPARHGGRPFAVA